MKKPEVENVEHIVYSFMCPICDEEYDDYDEAETCLNECWEIKIKNDEELKRKQELAPLEGQLDLLGEN